MVHVGRCAHTFAFGVVFAVAKSPFEMTAGEMLGSDARAEELLNANYGDKMSNGRTLSFGAPPDRLNDIQEWAKSPLPQKTKDYHSHHLNSDNWELVDWRDDDIVVGTCIKAGTTWTQFIVANLITKGDVDSLVNGTGNKGVLDASPWVDFRAKGPAIRGGALKGMKHRRFLKSHMPLDGMPYSPKAKYINVVRDGRDVAWSLWNHWTEATDLLYKFTNDLPGRVGPAYARPDNYTVKQLFDMSIDDGNDWYPLYWSCYHYMATWWQYRHLPNILHVHYDEMKNDITGSLKKIAKFLDITLTDDELAKIKEQVSIEWMKKHDAYVTGASSAMWNPGKFINKGTNSRWKDVLTDEDIAKYKAYSIMRMGEDGADWMMNGYPLDTQPTKASSKRASKAPSNESEL